MGKVAFPSDQAVQAAGIPAQTTLYQEIPIEHLPAPSAYARSAGPPISCPPSYLPPSPCISSVFCAGGRVFMEVYRALNCSRSEFSSSRVESMDRLGQLDSAPF